MSEKPREYNYYFNPRHPLKPLVSVMVANVDSIPPARATRVKPDERPGFCPCWDSEGGNGAGAWFYVEDHRGEKGFVNKAPFTIEDLGAYPEGWLKELPAPTEAEIKAQEKAQKKGELLFELSEIDRKAARPMRAILAAGDKASGDDYQRLDDLESQAEEIRDKLADLEVD
jgi:hypothetical protein